MGNKVPSSAAWLGGLGALPFVGLAGATAWLDGPARLLVAHALLAYGAAILSFLGGVHWGLAIAPKTAADEGALAARLLLSVVPSLVGWVALLLPQTSGLCVLAIAFAAMLWVDLRAVRIGQAPAWYSKIRIPLSCVVIASLLFGAVEEITTEPQGRMRPPAEMGRLFERSAGAVRVAIGGGENRTTQTIRQT